MVCCKFDDSGQLVLVYFVPESVTCYILCVILNNILIYNEILVAFDSILPHLSLYTIEITVSVYIALNCQMIVFF